MALEDILQSMMQQQQMHGQNPDDMPPYNPGVQDIDPRNIGRNMPLPRRGMEDNRQWSPYPDPWDSLPPDLYPRPQLGPQDMNFDPSAAVGGDQGLFSYHPDLDIIRMLTQQPQAPPSDAGQAGWAAPATELLQMLLSLGV